jgi:hypothetical protein
MRFTRDEFERAFQVLKLDKKLDVETTLEMMYRYGLIGFTKIGGGGYGGSAVAFSYRESNINFDPAAKYYTVHPGLKTLELIEAGEPG